MLLRWEEKCRVGNDQIDQERPFLFHPSHETALFLKGWLADPIVQQDTLLGAHLQNKKNDGAKSAQPA